MRSVGVHYKRWAYRPYDAALFIALARELGYDQVELDAERLAGGSVLTRTRIGFEARTHRIDLSYTWSAKARGDLASLDGGEKAGVRSPMATRSSRRSEQIGGELAQWCLLCSLSSPLGACRPGRPPLWPGGQILPTSHGSRKRGCPLEHQAHRAERTLPHPRRTRPHLRAGGQS